MIYSKFNWDKKKVLELSGASEAYIYYRNTRLNLLTGFPETFSLQKFLNKLDALYLQDEFKRPQVFHFYYELGLVLMGLGHTIKEDTPLAIELIYEKKRFIKKNKLKPRINNIPLKSLERPTWSEYKEAFNFIQEELHSGNCYQVNLTYPYDFETRDVIDPRDISDFFFSRAYLAPYAHETFLNDEMILSNSPECLFHYENNKVLSMPIKGTRARVRSEWKKSWNELLKDEKEEGELNMITDLLRNDLSRLDLPKARVLRPRSPLLVPGLIHQYSLLQVDLQNKVSLLKTLESLHPGGSVTGAPKKSVMEIIQKVERFQRGIYCGSTLLCIGEKKVASINIRTASLSISERLWRYGAGGAITLLSRPTCEFQEMESKVSSFLTLLNTPGY